MNFSVKEGSVFSLVGESGSGNSTVARLILRLIPPTSGKILIIYLGLNAVFVFSAPLEALAGKLAVGSIAGEQLGGPWLANAVTALVALTLVSSVSSMVMAGPRVYSLMAADGYLPRWLRTETGPPRPAIYLQCVLALLLLWSATFESLLTYIGFTLGLSTAATVFGLVRLRLREGKNFHVPGWPWIPALFLLSVLGTTTFSIARRPLESLLGLATIGAGLIAWYLNRIARTGRSKSS